MSAVSAADHTREPHEDRAAQVRKGVDLKGTDRGGRPSKVLNERVVHRVIDAITSGCTYESACAAGPISVRTFYDWMKQAQRDTMAGRSTPYVAFASRVEAANLEAERRITELWIAAIPGDWRAARDFLERRFSQRWRRPQYITDRADAMGGYVPPADFLAEDERAEALCDAIEAFVDQCRTDDASHTIAKATPEPGLP
jgi:hypothetical protein